jgi:2-phosphoglycerate kinase
MKKSNHHTLYVIGGLGRVGKTTVFAKLVERNHAITIQSDAIRAALRKVLIGESHVSVRKLHINARAAFQRPGNLTMHTVNHVVDTKDEDELAWIGIIGILETYDRTNSADVIVEGIAVTPERLHALKLKNLAVRAAFIGYNSESHLEAMIDFARKQKDWVHTSIEERGGDTSHVAEWVREGIVKSKKMERAAKKFGYGYFDITERPFKKHVMAVVKYLSS